jgi:putative transposase
MARANRHFIPGQIWHLTHRCHKREFLLKFARDRQRWLHWLYEAKKRFGLKVLNYCVTSNHVHLLVCDSAGGDCIAKSVQLIAGRTGQEYNQRKHRKGAFWEDRYHATAVEAGEHLLRCVIYIDLNMVRAGVVSHPQQWIHGGYREIQAPRRRHVLLDYETLGRLAGFTSFTRFQSAHKRWVESALAEQSNGREAMWTESLAVGHENFVASIDQALKGKARGRKIRKTVDDWELREGEMPYNANLGGENGVVEAKNLHSWRINDTNSIA